MGIVNRRNAVVGWVAWEVGKRVAKRQAKKAVPTIDPDTKRPNRPAIVAALAGLGGLLMLWRKKHDDDATFE